MQTEQIHWSQGKDWTLAPPGIPATLVHERTSHLLHKLVAHQSTLNLTAFLSIAFFTLQFIFEPLHRRVPLLPIDDSVRLPLPTSRLQ